MQHEAPIVVRGGCERPDLAGFHGQHVASLERYLGSVDDRDRGSLRHEIDFQLLPMTLMAFTELYGLTTTLLNRHVLEDAVLTR